MSEKRVLLPALIIESVGAQDLAKRRSEGEGLQIILRLLDVPCALVLASSEHELRTALRVFAKGRYSHLHLSCHGNENGIELTDGTFVRWSDLAQLFEAHVSSHYSLSISACRSGLPAVAEAFAARRFYPWLLIGTKADTEWGDALIGWAILLRHFCGVPTFDKWQSAIVAAHNAVAFDPVSWLYMREQKLYTYMDAGTIIEERNMGKEPGPDLTPLEQSDAKT